MSLSIDQFGNSSCSTTLQLLLTKPIAHPFGDEDDTASYVIAQNRELGTLTKFGRFIAWILEKLDKDHLNKAILNKIERDKEAVQRIKENKYFK